MSDVVIEIAEAIAEVLETYNYVLDIDDSDEAFNIAQEIIQRIPEIKEEISEQ